MPMPVENILDLSPRPEKKRKEKRETKQTWFEVYHNRLSRRANRAKHAAGQGRYNRILVEPSEVSRPPHKCRVYHPRVTRQAEPEM